jgi:succinate dehydrogenase / fumarate reductase cytochrome b subunit
MNHDSQNGQYPLPETMELILEVLGAEIVEYNRQELCCGAALSINAGRNEEALSIAAEKLDWMNEAGVQALSVACPACFTQFDTGQLLLGRKDKQRRMIPVYHIAELVAFALGADPENLNLKAHKIKAQLQLQQA